LFQIEKQINAIAYRLELPTSIKVHPVFYTSLLETYRESNFPSRIQATSPPIEIDDCQEYEVKDILDLRIQRS